ncbi:MULTISPECIES: DUF72 domain-containing protein [Rhizobium]|uniref:DUF72 domain-containing protein n=1 Tax=Rhizobium phaseoli TaxID=396 RepID=UPI000202E252|nr:DUF72 domain-containing protein [Rhizobium phaseoli]EGE59009.1 hypothetical protein RHECNPAF_2530089 [Rhizobium etli CNPAF512]KEC72243.1 hypothetical protein RLPCCGM1_c3617 [Rhizobium leguminosarum bv. phaseoli CCGM1]ANL32473.1 hypothetical protein AMC89_CH00358 [Rhizobium phaseoli]ANL96204.1 hypothetical protein AMC79_CH00358 [Rhizobium phaseoli]PWI56337.1 hypothetical protein B5K03_01415 [Rhizobium phaseoli]
MKKTGTVRIGISGWTYAPWRGQFYPKGLPQKHELSYAAQHFRSIEINGTFYGLQRPESFGRWRDETPEDFVFAVKGSRFITHMKRLQEIETPLANFFASGLLRLGPKLGPILWQFPPNMGFDPALFETFLSLLPHDRDAATALAKRHDGRLKGRAWLKSDADQPIRHAFEIRHDSFRSPAFIEMLRRHNVALVCADTVEWPLLMDITADFIYCRLHGSEQLYVSGYEDEALDLWAERIRAWATGGEPEHATRVLAPLPSRKKGRDIYLYFDNTDKKLRAPVDADHLSERLADLMPRSDRKAA